MGAARRGAGGSRGGRRGPLPARCHRGCARAALRSCRTLPGHGRGLRAPLRAALRGGGCGEGAVGSSAGGGRAGGGSGEAAAPRRRRAEPGGRWRRRFGPFKATAAVTRSPPEHPAPRKGCPVPDAGKAWRRRRRRRSPRNPGPRCGVRGGKAVGR